MKIRQVRLEIREAVLCASVKPKKVDFHSLDVKGQLEHLKTCTPRKALTLFKAKQVDPQVARAMLKRNHNIIDHIKRPTADQVSMVLDSKPEALNKLASSKRTEEMVIKAIRPEKRHLFGPRDMRAQHTLKNICALHPNTSFTPRVYHEVVRLMCGAPERTIKKLIGTFEKQKRKIPDELRSMIGRIKSKSLAADCGEECEDGINEELSAGFSGGGYAPSMVRFTYYPYTLTVEYPSSEGYVYEYYIGDTKLYKEALKLQCNPGKFSAFVKLHNFSVKKLKLVDERDIPRSNQRSL